ncbi:rhodanese-like domain-containing protein [Algoriphagus persicinus]|uniref:rhodanese-like domain-containing protein n=1 Tax=Algoriphagus persicinus TaxID=3108754 RepID=UPI002B36656D|nr:rhodanese-like domain-containing protein [Algoriphagus sp. E1-3-M2]MEB2784241.1 rhodanese-like domain-containing protein [Algoriphagus sp. E1-3-M2]
MKLQKILLLACALLMVSTVFTQAQSSEVKAITVSEFEELAKNKGAVRILDVRTPEEMAEGHLPNAKNIDYTNDNFKREIAKLDKKRTYLLYCKSGIRSGNAASIMKAAGFTHIYSLDGGIEAWQKAGKPIEK